jgi:hypothetical protein
MQQKISKATMSKEERDLRSRAGLLLSQAGLVHGSLSRRMQKCGKPSCRCTRGEKHETFVLVLRQEGQVVQIPIPKHLVPTVRGWVEQEKTLQDLVQRISELQTERIREMKGAKPGR